MGVLNELLGIASVRDSKDYRNRMLTGRDIATGASNYGLNEAKKSENKNSAQIENNNRQVILYKVEELKSRLNNCNTLYEEKKSIMDSLNLLYEISEELYGKEASKSLKK